jgi:thymidylate synthase (FAD)
MSVRFISITPDCEKTIVYCARVSSNNQDNPEISRLINYCIKNGHWSIFEMGNLIVEIEAPRFITTQILRHRSFSFQEFSQRYASIKTSDYYMNPNFRTKKETNRQSSAETHTDNDKYLEKTKEIFKMTFDLYNEMIENGVACETARAILPLSTLSKIYMNGTIRSWIHYLQIRCDEHTQYEHRIIANQIKEIFKEHLPIISQALNF